MMTTKWLEINQGSAPVLMSLPHTGTQIPDAIQSQLACSTEQALTDTDWYVHQLYDFVSSMGISTVRDQRGQTRLKLILLLLIDRNQDGSKGSESIEIHFTSSRSKQQSMVSDPIDARFGCTVLSLLWLTV